jgi:hypothetical protein
MKIGTDVSLNVCKAEGYMIMEYAGRGEDKLMAKGELQKEVRCEFYTYYPSYCLEEKGYLTFEDGRCIKPSGEGSCRIKSGAVRVLPTMQFSHWPKSMSQSYTAQDVWEMYLEHKHSINGMCGDTEDREFPKTPHELMNMACAVNSTGYFHTDYGEEL